jgi:lipopolysaccharide export system protein LptA
VNSSPKQPDRVSTSDALDATFRRAGGIDSIVQTGDFAYSDGVLKAWASQARYTPADQMVVLSGGPRAVEGGMTTTARSMRLNRTTGDAYAEGEVKSTYSDLKAQPDGALLASSSPIHVTARAMTARRNSATALYTGDARLWQDANVVQAPSLEFDRNRRSLLAQGAPTRPVSTVLTQTDKSGSATPVAIKAARLTYADKERKAHFDSEVTAQGAGVTVNASQMDVFLQTRGQANEKQALTSASKIDHIVAEGQVVVSQPSRKAQGDRLVFTAAEDKFVMTGGPPSIFDAEQGEITGVSLTFYRRDGRVLVEGNDTSPTVTHTRVAR